MKIDYELAEKIGAKIKNEYGQLFKFDENNQLLVCCDEVWRSSTYSIKEAVDYLKPIPPKPPVRVEYEKVTESIFDLKDEFTRGELHYNFGDGEWFTFKDERSLIDGAKDGNIYRRIETPITERDEFIEKVGDIQPVFDKRTNPMWAGRLYDAGCRFAGE